MEQTFIDRFDIRFCSLRIERRTFESRTDLVVKVNRVTTEERYPGLVFSEIDFHTAKARQHAYVAEVDVNKLTIATTTPFGEVNTMPTKVNTIPEQTKYLENSGRRVHVAARSQS